VTQLESRKQDAEHKLQETEKKMKDKKGKSKKVEEDHLKACQEIKTFLNFAEDMDQRINKIKLN
jgi:RNA polymerase-binding transcription factor DksA